MFTKTLYLRSVTFKVIALGRHGLESRLTLFLYQNGNTSEVGVVFLMSDSLFVFALGVRARPWWGLPQRVAVGVICPHLIFPQLRCHSDL